MRIHSILPALGATVLLTVTVGPSVAAQPNSGGGCTPTWQLMDTPPLGPSATVASVSALSAQDVFFTGGDTRVFGSGAAGIRAEGFAGVLRWNGHSFKSIAPLPAPTSSQPLSDEIHVFSATRFGSDTEGWSLAQREQYVDDSAQGLDPASTMWHWHDGRWTLTPAAVSADPEHYQGEQHLDVVSVSADDAWVVGQFGFLASYGALVEHWDGSHWSFVQNPAAAQPGAALTAISAVSPTNIWAVGDQADADTGHAVPLVEHWDGLAWTVVPVPTPVRDGTAQLQSVSTTRNGDVWAGGSQVSADGTSDELIEHWDGKRWSAQTLPSTDFGTVTITAIYAASPDDVWASGESPLWYSTAGPGALGVPSGFLHWDGRTWRSVPVPGPQEFAASASYLSLSGTGRDDVWAGGFVFNLPTGRYTPQIAHLTCGGR